MKTWVQSLALLTGLRIWRCPELWCQLHTCDLDPAWLWLWLAEAAPVGSLARELPYATDRALKCKKKKKKLFELGFLKSNLKITSCYQKGI